jgi:hypothetical protein
LGFQAYPKVYEEASVFQIQGYSHYGDATATFVHQKDEMCHAYSARAERIFCEANDIYEEVMGRFAKILRPNHHSSLSAI